MTDFDGRDYVDLTRRRSRDRERSDREIAARRMGLVVVIGFLALVAGVRACKDADRKLAGPTLEAETAPVYSALSWDASALVISLTPATSGVTFSTAAALPGPRWGISLRGAGLAPIETCVRCGRVLERDHTSHLSGGIALIDSHGTTFFDGCMECLRETVRHR